MNKTAATDDVGVDEIVETKGRVNDSAKQKKKLDKVVLDPANPLASARVLRDKQFTTADGLRTLWRHRGCFWLWSGSCYQLANDETIHTHIWTFLEKAKRRKQNKSSGKWEIVDFKPKRAHVGEVAAALTAICQLDEHIDPPTWLSLDAAKPPADEFLACANGLLHLPSGKLHPATPDYFGLYASTVVYDAAVKAPQWRAFRRNCWERTAGDQCVAGLDRLLPVAGYIAAEDRRHHRPAAQRQGNDRAHSDEAPGHKLGGGPVDEQPGRDVWPGAADPEVARHHLRRADRQRTDKSTIVERLLSISGEDRMTVARKFLPAWHGKLPVRMMLLTNELPALTDGSGAFASRLVLVVLTKSFLGKEDPQLTDKLGSELSGILNWGIAGYRRLNERGYFVQPESAREAVEAIELLAAPLRRSYATAATLLPA